MQMKHKMFNLADVCSSEGCDMMNELIRGIGESIYELSVPIQGGTSARGCDRGCDRFRTRQGLSAKSRECYGT